MKVLPQPTSPTAPPAALLHQYPISTPCEASPAPSSFPPATPNPATFQR